MKVTSSLPAALLEEWEDIRSLLWDFVRPIGSFPFRQQAGAFPATGSSHLWGGDRQGDDAWHSIPFCVQGNNEDSTRRTDVESCLKVPDAVSDSVIRSDQLLQETSGTNQ